jgi:soluble lytic murein transglycosylase
MSNSSVSKTHSGDRPCGIHQALCGLALACTVMGISAQTPAPEVSSPGINFVANTPTVPLVASPAQRGLMLDAREAFRKRDINRLTQLHDIARRDRNPLVLWVDYWETSLRIPELSMAEAEDFLARWPSSYVQDRFRNDWLLELGRRSEWRVFAQELPRFRMNDDREVACYTLLIDQIAGKNVIDSARQVWLAQTEADEGCATMAQGLYNAKQFMPGDVWRKARLAVDANRPRAVLQAVSLFADGAINSVITEVLDSPQRYLMQRASANNRVQAELSLLALMRLVQVDAAAAAELMTMRWEKQLPPELASWAWAMLGRQAAVRLQPQANDYFQQAARLARQAGVELEWPHETLAWKARTALRGDNGRPRWAQVLQAINAMSPSEQRESVWVYWKARALQVLPAPAVQSPVPARQLMESIATQFNFYGQLASEELGRGVPLPPQPRALTPQERATATRNPGMDRALQLISMGMRAEGVREWNYTLIGMSDRELLASAQLACDREIWDRCISTSDRTRNEIDLNQRFPTPFRREVLAQSRDIGIDPAYVYGLIRQESRFIMDARSNVGASGLMQLMPSTARWTAKRLGLNLASEVVLDRDTNIKLGTAYLKLVLDDLGGSELMGAAAYNAGPGRPRRWREGPTLEPAAWAENIPFTETRDYVKKVLSNATYYSVLLGNANPSLRKRLGNAIGPRERATIANTELP